MIRILCGAVMIALGVVTDGNFAKGCMLIGGALIF